MVLCVLLTDMWYSLFIVTYLTVTQQPGDSCCHPGQQLRVSPLFFPEKNWRPLYSSPSASSAVSPLFILSWKTDDLFCSSLSLLLILLGCHPAGGCHPAPFLPVRPRLSTIFCKFAHNIFVRVSPPGGCHPGRSALPLVTPQCWYINLRCGLDLFPCDLDLWLLSLNICRSAVTWWNPVPISFERNGAICSGVIAISIFDLNSCTRYVTLIPHLWPLDLELLQLFACRAFKLCPKFERNWIVHGWVIDELATNTFRGQGSGLGSNSPRNVKPHLNNGD